MNGICFDAEFANEGGLPEEILELSIWQTAGLEADAERRQVFHQYFRPVYHKRWPHSQSVHHISPAMVAGKPYFKEWRNKIQKIVDQSDFIIGFALENDIEALEKEGIRGLTDKKRVDVRDFHWLQNTRHQGVELNSRKNLAVTAADLGVAFSENLAHGADYDTRITLDCFRTLMESFVAAEGLEEKGEDEKLARYLNNWEVEREKALKEYAHGWLSLSRWRDGYRIKASIQPPQEKPDLVCSVEVAARQRAVDEIDARFDKKRSSYDARVYILSPKDVEWFGKYSNEYDGQEQLHKKMCELRISTYKAKM